MPTLSHVKNRYANGAKKKEEALCCPVNYNPQYLDIIPDEVIEKDYGCGDPSAYVQKGDVVLDLGAGGGKICFIAAQVAGPTGRVIGIDMTDEMLQLAKKNQPIVEEKLGYSNIVFKHGYIQDLKTDLDFVHELLEEHPVRSATDYKRLREQIEKHNRENPLIADESIDIIVSNCVLNLVADTEKRHLFSEMYRVLKQGGRIAISDIVSNKPSPPHLKDDPELWSGCISGALTETEFIDALANVGFYGITIDKYEKKPWKIIDDIEYRSVTVVAYKGKNGPCDDKGQEVTYRGPWKKVEDDDGHTFERGKSAAVYEKTFKIMTTTPYKQDIIAKTEKETLESCSGGGCGC